MTHYCLVCRREFFIPDADAAERSGRAECGQCDLPLIRLDGPAARRVIQLDTAFLLVLRRHARDVAGVEGKSPRKVLRGLEDAGGTGRGEGWKGTVVDGLVGMVRDLVSAARVPFMRMGEAWRKEVGVE